MSRWLAALLATMALIAGAVAVVLLFSARDSSQVAAVAGPGEALPDLCARHSDSPDRDYNSTPPTSGPHRDRLLGSDARRIGDDELLHALELGNVVLAYDSVRAPRPLRRLQEEVAGRFDAELAAAGQAVVLARRDDVDGVVALAWTRRLEASSPTDPALREFTEHWLGRGAGATGAPCPPAG